MAAVNVNRVNAPQAFVSSFAPRIRQYGNSLLTPVIPQSVVPNVRTTKRGTTAINYAEEFDEDSIEDSDNPRRATGLRTAQQRRDVDPAVEKAKELGKEATAPVEVQGIWRDWMGKPKRTMTERQLYLQAVLPTTLVPIRIDLDVAPFRPDAALPTPANAKDFGIDENLPAYKAPDVTPSYRLKDSFLWNLHEGLITPDMFAKVFVDELDFPVMRKQTMIAEIAQQIRQQLEEHAAAALHPLFQPQTKEPTAQTAAAPTPSLRHAISREDSSTPMQADTPRSPHPNNISLVNGHHSVSGAQTPLANGTSTPAITVTAQRSQPEETTSSVLNPPDTHRCVLNLSINLQNRLYTDKFEWSLQHPVGFAEIFAKRTCADIGLPGEWVPQMAHAIYESSLRLKKDMIDNNSTLAGVVGSGVDGWGVVDNEACEYHGTAESALGVGAGWRFDEDGLGYEWEPRIEVLNKEEIEKREGDRERQIRRQRRETARFTTNYAAQAGGIGSNDFFAGGLGASQGPNGIGGGEDERMGRGERSKKKRRFRSLSPVGRETPEAAGFGGTSAQLTEGERQYWTCSHCNIWGQAVWGVRDGPKGPRTLCHNCGLLYERDKRLPPWSHRLFALEKNQATREAQLPPSWPTQQPPARPLQTDLAAFTASQATPAAALSTSTPGRLPPFRVNSANSATPSHLHHSSSTPHHHSHTQHHPHAHPHADEPINPSSHLYTGASANASGGQGQISASTLADIVNYAEPGEDLDWTRITEPRERKRLQNIINGRKYRERRLAAEGLGGSGGNYPGAAGQGSFLSMGYGARQSLSAPTNTNTGTPAPTTAPMGQQASASSPAPQNNNAAVSAPGGLPMVQGTNTPRS
ncbi:uncharacterized protein K489DRAFT_376649 [Dissoconium aciculare CBS 342.82]|uniref:SNF5-domain-containing protein n=1 Tax=Dissoconium aciculare CBS 342.82 TaxID=1314786 RepID=A0A6J3MH82_9PEZI|nr:uncharacterized protein K489DRAFT_376649 [Dissoconium aciculare CBS 342.82]KAF1826252.1 hypothetical protein K489DRAFT_376649 [Dissoconium aciculare CBS 342.82]